MIDHERVALTEEILNTDRRIYQAIQASTLDEWLHVELTMRQLKILLLLASSGTESARMGQLAAALGVTMPTITGVVDRLVEQRLVRREEDPHDRRLVVARLTEGGRTLIGRLKDNGRTEMAATLERLSVAELRVVARALDLLLTAALSRERTSERASSSTTP